MAQHHANKIIIRGVPELHNKSCLESTKQFLLDTLSVQVNDGDIYSAKRIGKQGKNIEIQSTNEEDELVIQHVLCPHHVVIRCAPHFKVTLMASRKQLAGQVDPKGYKYFLASYMPDAFKVAKNKYRERVNNTSKENEGKLAKEQTKICILGPDLFINNKLITGLIQPPTPGEVCRAHKSYAEELSSFKLLATKPL